MLIKFKMVGLPLTAEEKLRETEYFFHRMWQVRHNVNEFPFNLSAFLAAFRSVTLYLQAQCSKSEQFTQWYAGWRDRLKEDPFIRTLKDVRDEVVHAKPVEMWIYSGPKIPTEGITIGSGGGVGLTTDNEGQIRVRLQLKKEDPEREVEPVTRWVFVLKQSNPLLGINDSRDEACEPNEREVFLVCDRGLQVLRNLVAEWGSIQ